MLAGAGDHDNTFNFFPESWGNDRAFHLLDLVEKRIVSLVRAGEGKFCLGFFFYDLTFCDSKLRGGAVGVDEAAHSQLYAAEISDDRQHDVVEFFVLDALQYRLARGAGRFAVVAVIGGGIVGSADVVSPADMRGLRMHGSYPVKESLYFLLILGGGDVGEEAGTLFRQFRFPAFFDGKISFH